MVLFLGVVSAIPAMKVLNHRNGVALETLSMTAEKIEKLPDLPAFTATSSNLTHDNQTYDNQTHDNQVDFNIPYRGLQMIDSVKNRMSPTPHLAFSPAT